jgi:hypothetical protein
MRLSGYKNTPVWRITVVGRFATWPGEKSIPAFLKKCRYGELWWSVGKKKARPGVKSIPFFET